MTLGSPPRWGGGGLHFCVRSTPLWDTHKHGAQLHCTRVTDSYSTIVANDEDVSGAEDEKAVVLVLQYS